MRKTVLAFAAMLALLSCSPATKLVWIEGEPNPDTKEAVHTLLICNPPAGTDWKLWGAFYGMPVMKLPDQDMSFSYQSGSFCVLQPLVEGKDTLKFNYRSTGLPRYSWSPEGFSIQTADGKGRSLDCEYWNLPGEYKFDNFTWHRKPLEITDMIPQLKSVTMLDGGSTRVAKAPEALIVEGQKPSWYRITLDGSVKIEASDADGAWYASVTLARLKENAGSKVLPNMVIEDWPDLEYRGIMIDAGRTFYSKKDMFRLLDEMSRLKLNYLQFHLTDDEGWRLEVPSIPELTSYGAFHRLPTLKDGRMVCDKALYPSYDGSIDPKDRNAATQGYYSHQDMVDIVRYAASLHITVIPEIDTPGHSSASLLAMKAYVERTGDESLQLYDRGAKAGAASVQHFTGNTLNVALPSTYKFIGIVLDELCSIYADAGVPFREVHLGGDEVPERAWSGSPACQKLMAENGWTSEKMFTDYYVNRILDLTEERGLKLDGWQEIAEKVTPETSERLCRSMGFINAWSTLSEARELPYIFANKGLPVLMCNVNYTYVDLAYNGSKFERGLDWGGYIDEETTYCFLPFDTDRGLRRTALEHPENIRGAQIHMWGENIRSFDQACYAIFPKAYGIFERAWNAHPVWEDIKEEGDPRYVDAFDKFYSIVADRELPSLDSRGINHREAARLAD